MLAEQEPFLQGLPTLVKTSAEEDLAAVKNCEVSGSGLCLGSALLAKSVLWQGLGRETDLGLGMGSAASRPELPASVR